MADQPKRRAKRVTVKAAMGTGDKATLLAMAERIAEAIDDPDCPARDLSPLSRRLIEIRRELHEIETREGEDAVGKAAATPDEAFDVDGI